MKSTLNTTVVEKEDVIEEVNRNENSSRIR